MAEPKLLTTYLYHGEAGVSCAPAGASTQLLCQQKQEATTDTTGAQGVAAMLDAAFPARIWSWTYNAQGQMLTATDPRNNVTTYTYHTATTSLVTQGDLASMTTPAPAVGQPTHVTQFIEYDGAGRLKKMIDPNGLETTLTYWPRGWLKKRTVGSIAQGEEITLYDYDNVGQLTKVTQPDDSYVQYHYDAAQRLWKIEDSQGNNIIYTLDNLGNRTAEEYRDPSNQLSRKLTREYDALNRLKFDRSGYTPAAPTVAQSVTQYAYDNQGNLKKITDPLNRITDNDYDALSRLIMVTDPQTPTRGVTEYGYDGQDNLTLVKDPKLLNTTYTYNGLGDLKTQVSPDTGTTTFTHDVAGNVLTKTDARSVTATYTYDALNQVATISYPAVGTDPAETVTYTYDTCTNGKGRLCQITDKTGTTAYVYDIKGRVTGKSQTNGSLTQSVGYGYNAAGQLATVTYPSGRVVTYTYTNSRPVSVTINGTPLLSNAVYEPFGPIGGWSWGNSTQASPNLHLRVFDLDYRTTEVSTDQPQIGSTPVLRWQLTWDAVSRVTQLNRGVGFPFAYQYDNVDRLTSMEFYNPCTEWPCDPPMPPLLTMDYDRVGNRLWTHDGTSLVEYGYAATSHRLQGLSGGQTMSFTHDGAGNQTGDGTYTWRYGGNNRPYEVQTPIGVVSFTINALGQRIKKSTPSSTTRFFYDEQGRLLGEYDDVGTLIQETLWLNDLPAGVSRPGGEVFYVHADHLGTPRAITRPSDNQVVWKWDSVEPFGNNPANENPSGLGVMKYNNRFPGQYYDEETGTHYNYFRDYDPVTGRYRQSDPIGLEGGVTTYCYVAGNPIQSIDPFGLIEIPNPNNVVPGGPWVPHDANRPGQFLGPKPASGKGGRPQCQFVPSEGQGGPPGSRSYWKVNQPGQSGWQRFDLQGKPISIEQAHRVPQPRGTSGPPVPLPVQSATIGMSAAAAGVIGLLVPSNAGQCKNRCECGELCPPQP